MLIWRWFQYDFMAGHPPPDPCVVAPVGVVAATLAPAGSTATAPAPLAGRDPASRRSALRRDRGQKPLRLPAPDAAEPDQCRAILAGRSGAPLFPLHDRGGAHSHQARDPGLGEGQARPELPDETG